MYMTTDIITQFCQNAWSMFADLSQWWQAVRDIAYSAESIEDFIVVVVVVVVVVVCVI